MTPDTNGHAQPATLLQPGKRTARKTPVDLEKATFTSSEVATVCDVAPATASRWMARGEIRGCHTLPGSKEKRAPRQSLLDFLRENRFPVPPGLEVAPAAAEGSPDRPFSRAKRQVPLDLSLRSFTTGQVSALCDVSTRMASGWIDSGLLEGYRLPGSTDRRVPREALVAFMRRHNLPIPGGLAKTHPRLLVLALSPDVPAALARCLPGWACEHQASMLRLGVALAESEEPLDAVVLADVALGYALDAAAQARRLHPGCRVVLLLGEDDHGRMAEAEGAGFEGVLCLPCDMGGVVKEVIGGR